MTDDQFSDIKIRGLEKALLEARQDLWDACFLAALPCYLDFEAPESACRTAAKVADTALAVRDERIRNAPLPTYPVTIKEAP